MTSSNKSPNSCDRLPASNPSQETLDLLLRRRSLTVKDMTDPGPDEVQIKQLLTIGSRVPDHKKQVPWRFLTFEGNARSEIGRTLRNIFTQNNPGTEHALLDFEENRFSRAPLVIGVISTATPDNPKVPEWEQILTAGAVCQNIMIGANAMGFAGQWLSEWYCYDDEVLSVMNLEPHERMAGFIYIGTASKEPGERGRPDVSKITQAWQAQTD